MTHPTAGSPSPTDGVELWLAAAQAGDPEALNRLFEVCRPYLLLVANKELGADLQPKVAPSDLVQQTLLEANRDLVQFTGSTEDELKAWLSQILWTNLANVRRDYCHTKKRQLSREVPLDDPNAQAIKDALLADTPTPSGQAMAREQEEAVRQALARLPEDCRQAILLRHYEGHTFKELAERIPCENEKAAKRLWKEAIDKLTKALGISHEP